MKFSTTLISGLVVIASLIGSPVLAASQKVAVVTKDVASQQQQFHSVLDAYLAANEKLETRINRSATLDEPTRNHLLALTKTEKSRLLSIRSKLFSTLNKKEIQDLAKDAKRQREAAKIQEDHIIIPLLTLSTVSSSTLPTAEARVESMDTTLTKAQSDRATKELGAIKDDAVKLHDALMSNTPPTNAGKRIELLQEKTKNVYRTLRAHVK